MTWTAPLTVADGDLYSASQYNKYIRDNLLETAPAKAATNNYWFAASGTNAIAQRGIIAARVTASEQTTSTTYGDLTTFGPSVTLTTGKSAFVFINARMNNPVYNGRASTASFSISGSTTWPADDQFSISSGGVVNGQSQRFGAVHHVGWLAAGTNTFTMKYKTQAGYPPSQFEKREIIVMSF
jgi:hypothetical protein